ncbi:c-type cytochrome biogenesis protein CcsB [Aquipuribacter hungaricus]|uniref:C-type cytochrome biogenesis protein CcsB n=1 Tax=Aquipuribacter hungaricus TaxID=545624 RepID=A0ABV7WH31_9MICO
MSAVLTGLTTGLTGLTLGAGPGGIGGTPADPALAGISDGLVYSAMAAYAVALVAFAVDLAGGRRTRGAVREEALVGAGGAGSTAGSTAASTAQGSGTAAATPGRRALGIGSTVFVLATLLHVAALVARGASVQRVPWSDAYEFAVSGAAVVSVVYLVLLRDRARWGWLGSFVVVPVLLTLMVATSFFYTEASALSPALQSSWLVVHVSIAFLASALLTIGFSLAVVQLVQHRQDALVAAGGEPSRLLQRVPSARQLEQTSFQLHAVAFVLWTFTVVAGAIWAAEAWGRYWGWDPKEVWSFVIWVVYAAYLHARATAGWAGPRSAWIAVLGFACLLFNFLGVNYLFVGNHSYAL